MTADDFKAFRRYVDGVYEQYGKPPLSETGINIMFRALADLSLDVVLAGLSRHAQVNRFIPPNAASVRECAIGTADDRATRAYGTAIAALRRINSGESVRFDDPAIHYAIQTGFGGWLGFSKCQISDSERIFTKYYAAAIRLGISWQSPEVPDHLAGLRECRGSVIAPWSSEQVVPIQSNTIATTRRLGAG